MAELRQEKLPPDHPAPTWENTPFAVLAEKPHDWALFLDIDGSLLDLAPSPDEIAVPPDLPDDLYRLSNQLDGALALVTGRALLYADALFQPHIFPIAGLHGAEMRGHEGRMTMAHSTPEFEDLKRNLSRLAEPLSGVIIEDKGAAVAAHYRLAPYHEEHLHHLMKDFVRAAGSQWALQLGKFVFEVRPSGANKGDAMETFLREPPFIGRMPFAVGDDLTDESMFAVANARGGQSVRVGRADISTCARHSAASPALVRQMIKSLGV